VSRIRALVSPAIRAAWLELAPPFEKSSGHRLAAEWAGIAAIRKRVGEGEVFDLVVGSSDSMNELIGKSKIHTLTDLVKAEAGVGVRKGARRPDLSSVEALKRELRAARKIGYSTGPSGLYLAELFKRWGMARELAPKLLLAPSGVMVGTFIARGEVDFGVQQKSELLQVEGVDYAGPLPAEIGLITAFTAGFPTSGKEEEIVKTWLAFFTSPGAAPVLRKHGLEPVQRSGLHEQREKRVFAALRAPVAVDVRIEARAFGQPICRVEVVPRPEDARFPIPQADFHLAAEDEHPLRLRRAVPLAAEAHRARAQLVAAAGENLRQHRLRIAFG
jgi:molybdate transport system substrate-binding protein